MREIYELEKERLSLLVKLKLASIFSLFIGLVAFVIFYFYMQREILLSIFMGVFSTLFFYAFIRNFLTSDFNKDFKLIAIQKVIESFGLTYESENFIKYSKFTTPNIYLKPDTYSGNDLVYGSYNGVDFEFSDVFLQKRVQRVDEKGKVYVSYETIFRGICFIANFNKNFTSTTYALSRNRNVSFFKIIMDNSEFEKEFNVYSSDKINAFYILTPNFMERILRLKNLFKSPLNLAFLDNKIYIYIEFGRDSFEPDVRQSLVGDYSIILRYKAEILELLNIINELNLNRKIFTSNEI